jgi:hypothetical protein
MEARSPIVRGTTIAIREITSRPVSVYKSATAVLPASVTTRVR